MQAVAESLKQAERAFKVSWWLNTLQGGTCPEYELLAHRRHRISLGEGKVCLPDTFQ
jgi:hypothetical protein